MSLNTTNVAITAGSGTNIETENVPQPGSGSGDRQRMQIAGRAGSSSTESANDVAVVVNADAGTNSTAFGLQVRVAGRVNPSYCNGAITQTAVTVTTGTQAAIPSSPASNRRMIYIVNTDSGNTVYIGGGAVTASGSSMGIPVGPGELFSGPFGPSVTLYAIASGASLIVSVMEISE